MERIWASVQDAIAEKHWMVVAVPYDNWLSYTVGLANRGLPEIVHIGLDPDLVRNMINNVAQRMIDLGAHEGKYAEIIANYDVELKRLPPANAKGYANVAFENAAFHQIEPSFFELLMPDADGRFPDDKAYSLGIIPLYQRPPRSI
jgi:hypothetical protein